MPVATSLEDFLTSLLGLPITQAGAPRLAPRCPGACKWRPVATTVPNFSDHAVGGSTSVFPAPFSGALVVSYGERLCDPHLCPSFVAMDLYGPDLKSAEYDQRSGKFERICLTEPVRVVAKCLHESWVTSSGLGNAELMTRIRGSVACVLDERIY